MSECLRVGLIGAGVMGGHYVRVIENATDAAIAAVCDLDGDRAARLAARCETAQPYDSVTGMLAEEELDAAVVATPDFAHREPAVACLERGLALLCEKPLAQTMADCRAIIEAQRGSAAPLMVNYGNRHRANARHARDIIAEGQLGRPQYAYLRLNEKLSKTRELSWLARTSPTWFLLSHCTDLICWMLGERLHEVRARASLGAVAEFAPGVPDLVIAQGATEAGTLINLESCWALPDGYAHEIDFFVQVLGTRGALQMDLFAHDMWLHTPARGGVRDYTMGVAAASGHLMGWWPESVRYFLRCVARGEAPEPGPEEAASVSQALLAIERSWRTGQEVAIADVAD